MSSEKNFLDVRGLSCPQPVLQTRRALESGANLTVLADSKVAVENIRRLVSTLGHRFSVEEQDGEFCIKITAG